MGQWIKTQGKVTFVEWCPTGFKIGLNDVPPAKVEGDPMEDAENTAVMIGNNIAVNRVFSDRLSKKYDMMYSQRAYVHWYVGEGMEEGEFSEAREDLGFLEKDYLDVITEQASDEQSNGDDDEFQVNLKDSKQRTCFFIFFNLISKELEDISKELEDIIHASSGFNHSFFFPQQYVHFFELFI